eukprot:3257926-Amphidinium_carterae.1
MISYDANGNWTPLPTIEAVWRPIVGCMLLYRFARFLCLFIRIWHALADVLGVRNTPSIPNPTSGSHSLQQSITPVSTKLLNSSRDTSSDLHATHSWPTDKRSDCHNLLL